MSGSPRVAPAAAKLAEIAPFRIGAVNVDPATRQLLGPLGTDTLEPRLMMLLVALHDAAPEVLTRDRLAQIGWEGRFVADDSLNAAIAGLRKALRGVSDGTFIETVPKTGYRLSDFAAAPVVTANPAAVSLATAQNAVAGTGRRTLLLSAAAAVAVGVTGLSLWNHYRVPPVDPRVEALLARGNIDLRLGYPDPERQGLAAFSEAVRIDPGHAESWGLLAVSWRAVADYRSGAASAEAYRNAEAAARRALAIDPRQGDALAALAQLEPIFGNWSVSEARIRDALVADPLNFHALGALALLAMSTGQARLSERINEDLVARFPNAANRVFRLIYSHWNAGHPEKIEALATRAMQRWPDHPAIWFSRFWTFTFTQRTRFARAMLDDVSTALPLPPPFLEMLRSSLDALEHGGAHVPRAIAACRAMARAGPGAASSVIMLLSALGDPEGALEVSRSLMLQSGAIVVPQSHSERQASVNDQHTVFTMMLWTPPAAPLRALPGFNDLCAAIGLVDYWRKARVGPDFTIGGRRI